MIAKTIAGALLAALSALPAAAAQIVDLRYAGSYMTETTSLVLPVGGTQNYQIGLYKFETQNPGGSFIGYCADPFQWASNSFQTYEAKSFDSSFARYDNVKKLFGHAYADSLTGATKAAGFQLALYEVFNDDGQLGSGQVRATPASNATIVSEAQSLLDALPNWTNVGTDYDLRFYANANYQDYIAVGDIVPAGLIPEPDQYALLLAGLGLLGFMARRRIRF